LLGPIDWMLATDDKKVESCWVFDVHLWVQDEDSRSVEENKVSGISTPAQPIKI